MKKVEPKNLLIPVVDLEWALKEEDFNTPIAASMECKPEWAMCLCFIEDCDRHG